MKDLLSRLAHNGAHKLALGFPPGALRGAWSTLTAALGEDGFLVSGGTSAPWRFESTDTAGDAPILLGPDPFGSEWKSLDDPGGREEGFERLLALVRALLLLKADGSLPRGIVSSCILFRQGGEASLLVLPPKAVARALASRGPEERSAAFARLASPRSQDAEADASFLLAQAAYRLASGAGPFGPEAADQSAVVGASSKAIPAGLAAPALDPALAALIDKALAEPGSAALAEWESVLEAGRGSRWLRELSQAEEAELSKRAAEMASRLRGRARAAAFLRKRGGLLIGAAVALVIVGLVYGELRRAQLDRPDFSALAPHEIALRYYKAIDGLDLESLEACGGGKAVRGDRDSLLTLTVLTKTKMAYEGKNPIVRAADWIEAGKPPIKDSDFLYGVTGLSVTGGESYGEATRVAIRAEYSMWTLERVEDPSSPPGSGTSVPKEERRVDNLVLEKGPKGWKIAELDRSER
jgi:hypothetical protein